MCRRRHVLSKPEAVSLYTNSAPSARWKPGTCVGSGVFSRSRELFPCMRKARQARAGNRGHVSVAARSLEAGACFPAYE
ncbi:MAG: hypothetical protein FWF77_01060 [Defluviitaleaceae bacterium]|nr:hypothetical protein [Defluviitaleaceae bacterium]